MKRTLLAGALLIAGASVTASAADLTLYGRQDFRGRELRANDTIVNLANSGFNDRASSAVIRGGVWQLCEDAHFRGQCVTLGPGEYPTLRAMGLNNSVSSAREVRDWHADRGRDGRWAHEGRHRSRAVIFSNPDFRGDRFVVAGNYVPDLANSGFNDRAQSLRVESGTWMFCSDADLRGVCRTFGPGNYPELPRALNNRLSSGRRIG
jgi:hypothetical protein